MRKASMTLLAAFVVVAFAGTAVAGPWYAKGDYYCVPGCWNFDAGNEMYDDGATGGDAVAADGIFTGTVTSDAAAGRKEFKVALDDWSVSYPGGNAWVHVSGPGDVAVFTLDTNVYADGWFPTQNIVCSSHAAPPGTTFEVMGSAPETGAWAVGTPLNDMGGGLWSRVISIGVPGNYEAKFRATGTWDVMNVGSDGIDPGGGNLGYTTNVPNEDVLFELNRETCRARVTVLGATPTLPSSWGRVKTMYR